MFNFDHSLGSTVKAIGLETAESVFLTIAEWIEEDVEISRIIERVAVHETLNNDEKLWAMFCLGQVAGAMQFINRIKDNSC